MSKMYDIWCEFEHRCNLNCKYCYNEFRNNDELITETASLNKIINVLNTLYNNVKVKNIALSGGEITLMNGLDKILELISKKNTPIILATNGTTINEDRVKYLINSGVKTFQIPINSDEKYLHDLISSHSSWEKAMKTLISIKNYSGNAVIVFVATRLNLFKFINVLEIAAFLKINFVIFNIFMPLSGNGKKNSKELLINNSSEILDVLYKANDFARKHKIKIKLGTPFNLNKKDEKLLTEIIRSDCPVYVNQNKFVLDGFGNIKVCSQSNKNIGNIFQNDIKRTLQSQKIYEKIRIDFKKGECCLKND